MRPWTAVFFVVAFVSGASSGFIVGRNQQPQHSGEIPTRVEVLNAFTREVGLDTEQRAQFEKIFDANHGRFTTVKTRIAPELAAIRSEVRIQLRAALREDQKQRFDEYCNKRDVRRDENMR